MMSRCFALTSEFPGGIAKRLPHAKNLLSVPDSFFNQFVTEIFGMLESFGYGSRPPVSSASLRRKCLHIKEL